LQHVVVVIPENPHVGIAQRIGEQRRNGRAQRFHIGGGGRFHLQHHDGEDDRQDTVAESFEPALFHARFCLLYQQLEWT
jgi:hypothetical protein